MLPDAPVFVGEGGQSSGPEKCGGAHEPFLIGRDAGVRFPDDNARMGLCSAEEAGQTSVYAEGVPARGPGHPGAFKLARRKHHRWILVSGGGGLVQ